MSQHCEVVKSAHLISQHFTAETKMHTLNFSLGFAVIVAATQHILTFRKSHL